MPILHLYVPLDTPPPGLLEKLCAGTIRILRLPPNHCWAMWHEIAPHNFFRPGWSYGSEANGPIVILYCKNTYEADGIEELILYLRDTLSSELLCDPTDVYVAVQRVRPGETLVRGDIWRLRENA
jgi:hypothetical protein